MAHGARTQTRRRAAAACCALGFGALAGALVAGGVVVWLPGALVVTDPREAVVSLGAALSGPLGGAFVGFAAGIFERIPGMAMLSALGHAAAGAWMGWAYRRISASPRCRQHVGSFLLAWVGALVVYYAGVLYPVAILASLAVPSIWAHQSVAGFGPGTALPKILADASYEFVGTALFTSAVWFALPRPLRQPLLCDQTLPPASPPPARLRGRRLSSAATRWLVALAAGLAAAMVIVSGLHCAVPGTQLTLDPRETLVVLGAALAGPGPAVLVGVLAGAFEPLSGTNAASMVMHCAGAVAVALAYRRLAARCADDDRLPPFLARWCALVLLYYLAILLPLTLLYAWEHPAMVQTVLGVPHLTAAAAALVAAALLWESVVTCLLTAVALWAMPRRARRPIGVS